MNCHLCAGIKHKVLLRRLLATFFDRLVMGQTKQFAFNSLTVRYQFCSTPTLLLLSQFTFTLHLWPCFAVQLLKSVHMLLYCMWLLLTLPPGVGAGALQEHFSQ